MSQNSINYKKYFEDKQITKQGFGFLGRGANVVKFLLENGANVLVTDMKSETELEKSIKEVEDFIFKNNIDKSKITYRLGEHRLEDFTNCDYVIAASGVDKDNIYLQAARDANKKVYQESSLFAEMVLNFNNDIVRNSVEKDIFKNTETIKIIGVTGTRGKTTTTFLIKAVIENYLKDYNIKNNTERKSVFGGNVQNVATLEQIKYLKAGDVIVMELDSWVLQGFADIKFSPHLSVFTTFMPDHMNYYKGSMKEYFLDKAAIFLNQKEGDVFFSTAEIYNYIELYMPEILTYSAFKNAVENIQDQTTGFLNLKSSTLFLSESFINSYSDFYKSKLLGEHNKVNMALAVRACEEFMQRENANTNNFKSDEIKNIIQETLNTFTGVPGRLEFVKEVNGVKYYNDTTATTPDALIVALESFKDGNIILICGGRDKELNISKAAEKIIDFKNKNILKSIILLSNDTTNGSERFLKIFKENNFTDFVEVVNIQEAVERAARSAALGDTVLFSPGFASFGMFLNEYDRGEKYLEALNSVQ